MHIEPGIVEGSKMALSYATATAVGGLLINSISQQLKRTNLITGSVNILVRSFFTTVLVFSFFEILPHYPVGISEVHFILGSTLFLLFGRVPAAIGLAAGLFLQGILFAPSDMPQYFINTTTLLAPLFLCAMTADRIIPANTAYANIQYSQAFKLSLVYQGGIVAWVMFWAFYGQGFHVDNLAQVGSFSVAYISVVLIEPIVDLGVLALAKFGKNLSGSPMIEERLFQSSTIA